MMQLGIFREPRLIKLLAFALTVNLCDLNFRCFSVIFRVQLKQHWTLMPTSSCD